MTHRTQESAVFALTILLEGIYIGWGPGGNAELPCPLPVESEHITLLACQCVHQLEHSHEPYCLEFFIGVSLQRQDWLNHWLCGWAQSPVAFPSLEIRLPQSPNLLYSCGWCFWWSTSSRSYLGAPHESPCWYYEDTPIFRNCWEF